MMEIKGLAGFACEFRQTRNKGDPSYAGRRPEAGCND